MAISGLKPVRPTHSDPYYINKTDLTATLWSTNTFGLMHFSGPLQSGL